MATIDPDDIPASDTPATQSVRQLADELHTRWSEVDGRLMSAMPDNTLSIPETDLCRWLSPVDAATWLATIEISTLLSRLIDGNSDVTRPVPSDTLRGLAVHIEYNTIRDTGSNHTTVLSLGIVNGEIGQTPQVVTLDTDTYLTIYQDIYRRFTDAVGYRVTSLLIPVERVNH